MLWEYNLVPQEEEESEEEEEEEEEEIAIQDLRRGPAGLAPRLACTIAIQLHISVILVPLSVLRVPLQAGQKEKEEEGTIRDLRRGPAGSAPRLACTIANPRRILVILVPLWVLRVPLQADQKEQEEEEEEEEEEVAIRALRRGPAGSAPRLACTIAIQLRM